MDVTVDVTFENMVEEYLINRIARMESGELTNTDGLFHPALWRNLTELERNYQFEPTIDILIDDGVLNLEIVERDGEGRALYRVL